MLKYNNYEDNDNRTEDKCFNYSGDNKWTEFVSRSVTIKLTHFHTRSNLRFSVLPKDTQPGGGGNLTTGLLTEGRATAAPNVQNITRSQNFTGFELFLSFYCPDQD